RVAPVKGLDPKLRNEFCPQVSPSQVRDAYGPHDGNEHTPRAIASQRQFHPREFDVVVGAPAEVAQVGADSPYYAGTIAFFGNMMRMEGSPTDATFAVPLPRAPEAFHAFVEAKNALLNVRILPAQGRGEKVPALKSASIRALILMRGLLLTTLFVGLFAQSVTHRPLVRVRHSSSSASSSSSSSSSFSSFAV